MKIFVLLLVATLNVVGCLKVTTITGTTPPPVPCPKKLCEGKDNGNYEYKYYGVSKKNYFVQCSNKIASCQPCFPLRLEFSEKCNQCLLNKNDECIVTAAWEPPATSLCPDKCSSLKEKDFTGNIGDPYNPKQYIACYLGKTIGCLACPGKLLFNEDWNACIYGGKFKTEKTEKY